MKLTTSVKVKNEGSTHPIDFPHVSSQCLQAKLYTFR